MKLLILDHNDSFTYNLRQLFQEAGCREIVVCRSAEFRPEDISAFDRIVFSPGPGLPDEFPAMKEILLQASDRCPVLGICLGHQAIASFFGARLQNLNQVVHGQKKRMQIRKDDRLFNGIPDPFTGGLYHSWMVSKENFPEVLELLAESEDGHIMALRHAVRPIHGVQFHPESFMTESGLQMIRNWLY